MAKTAANLPATYFALLLFLLLLQLGIDRIVDLQSSQVHARGGTVEKRESDQRYETRPIQSRNEFRFY